MSSQTFQPQPNIKSNMFYIVQSSTSCWICKKTTEVACIVVPQGHESFESDSCLPSEYAASLNELEYLNDEPLTILGRLAPSCFLDYSQQADHSYLMNHCSHCRAKLGDFYLHSEPGGPFFPITSEDYKAIHIQRFDIAIEAEASTSIGPLAEFLEAKHECT